MGFPGQRFPSHQNIRLNFLAPPQLRRRSQPRNTAARFCCPVLTPLAFERPTQKADSGAGVPGSRSRSRRIRISHNLFPVPAVRKSMASPLSSGTLLHGQPVTRLFYKLLKARSFPVNELVPHALTHSCCRQTQTTG